jgi:hypothetical protein
VIAVRGDLGDYPKGSVIGCLAKPAAIDGVEIFRAGTKREGARILANGGRVLNICAVAESVEATRDRACAAVDKIRWPERHLIEAVAATWRAARSGRVPIGAGAKSTPTRRLWRAGAKEASAMYPGELPSKWQLSRSSHRLLS